MRRLWLPVGLLALAGGCQAIADLSIPSYDPGAAGSSAGGQAGASGGLGGAAGQGGKAGLSGASGQGGASAGQAGSAQAGAGGQGGSAGQGGSGGMGGAGQGGAGQAGAGQAGSGGQAGGGGSGASGQGGAGQGGSTAGAAGSPVEGCEDSAPPCSNHLKLWWRSDDPTLFKEVDGHVTEWKDARSGWIARNSTGRVRRLVEGSRPFVRFNEIDTGGAGGEAGSAGSAGQAGGAADQGMRLEPTGALALPAFAVFFSLRSLPLPSGVDPRSEAIVWLGSKDSVGRMRLSKTKDGKLQMLTTGLVKGQSQSKYMTYGADAGPVSDGWRAGGAQYFCDYACYQAGGGAKAEIFMGGGSVAPSSTTTPISFDPKVEETSWLGVWDRSWIGDDEGSEQTEPMRGDVGEILVYDAFLDGTTRDAVRAYLTKIWLAPP